MKIILKDLKIGLGHETLFKFLDENSLEVYNSTSSLVEVCNYLRDPKNSKYCFSYFQLFFPIKPMLAGRMSVKDIYTNFSGTSTYVETKYDGERIQCHKQQNEVKFFTRNGIDYTYLYGPKLSSLIIESINAKSCILDGEVVVWDKVNNKFAPFGENKPTANSNENEKQLCYVIFDILYLISPRGEEYSLSKATLMERKKVLERVITPIPNRIEIISSKETNNVDEIMSLFSEAIFKGEEGLIIKKKESYYKIDERGSDWVKLKSDYLDNLTDTMDLIVIGGYYGEGRRRGGLTGKNPSSNIIQNWNDSITTFLLGVVKVLNIDNPKETEIMPICKVGTGYTFEQLEIMQIKLKPYWKKYDQFSFTKQYSNWKPALSERPDVFIDDPSKSIIIELRAGEIVPSDAFPTKLTFRFPRVDKIRHDKNWNECMTYQEVSEFYNNSQHNQLFKKENLFNTLKRESLSNTQNNSQLEPISSSLESKANLMSNLSLMESKDNSKQSNFNKLKKVNKYTKIIETYRDTNTDFIQQTSDLFKGLEFLVLNLSEDHSKNSLEKKNLEMLIVEHGGSKVQNYMKNTTHVIANRVDLKVKSLINSKKINVYNQKWLYECIKLERIIKVSPLFLTYANEITKKKFELEFDKYNDSYFEDINSSFLKEFFNLMKENNNARSSKSTSAQTTKSNFFDDINLSYNSYGGNVFSSNSNKNNTKSNVNISVLNEKYEDNETEKCFDYYFNKFINIVGEDKYNELMKD